MRGTRFGILRSPRTWAIPLVLVFGLAALFPAIYLSATVDPQGNLEGLPIALVVEPQDEVAGAPDFSASIASAVEDSLPDGLTVSRLTTAELDDQMAEDGVAGAIVIPADFNSSIASLLSPTATEITIARVEILTNAGDGGLSNGIVAGNVTPVLVGVSESFGAQLAAGPGGESLSPATRALLAEPFRVASSAYSALPDNSGLGTSAFYFALVLVLVGFIGASLVNPLVDSSLGFVPSEVGPIVQRSPYLPATRFDTLLAKFAIMLTASPLAALIIVLVSTGPVGIPVSDPFMLWLLSTAAIAAIGTSALSVFAIFGSGIGSIVNTLFFIALSMTSSGGTVPLEATPALFRWLSEIEPFYAVVEGVRALLYFDGNGAAGLDNAWLRIAVGGVIGLAVGLIATALFGRVPAFSRHPRALADATA